MKKREEWFWWNSSDMFSECWSHIIFCVSILLLLTEVICGRPLIVVGEPFDDVVSVSGRKELCKHPSQPLHFCLRENGQLRVISWKSTFLGWFCSWEKIRCNVRSTGICFTMWNISNSDFDVKSTGLKHQFGEIEHGPILTFEDDAISY